MQNETNQLCSTLQTAMADGYELFNVPAALHRMQRLQEAYQNDGQPNPGVTECMAIVEAFRWKNRRKGDNE